jgi:heat shock protein HtpX
MQDPALAQTFYEARSKNRWRTLFLFALFPVMLLTITYLGILIAQISSGGDGDPTVAFAQAGDAFFAFSPFVIVGATLWTILMVMGGGKRMILSMSGAKAIEKRDNPELYRMVENLAIQTGIKTPQVYVIEDESMNAFATGFTPDKAAVTVTTGILKRLDPQEMEAVLAHEFGHILNRDTRVMLIAITLVGVLQLFADLILRGMWYSGRVRTRSDNRKGGGGAILLLAILVVWIIGFIGGTLVQLGISRKREFLADAESAALTRDPRTLASALRKISTDARVEVLDGKRTIAALCIADPLEQGHHSFLDALQGLFSTHPKTEDRIAELEKMGA